MEVLVFTLIITSGLVLCSCSENVNITQGSTNMSDSNQDMYVIHAMVYQVGILTNRTDDESNNTNTTGSQETLTFYHNNGSMADIARIAEPLLTNVTAQSMVAVAPVVGDTANTTYRLPWASLSNLADAPYPPGKDIAKTGMSKLAPFKAVDDIQTKNHKSDIFKRETLPNEIPVKIVKGSALIPEAIGVHSLALPSLFTINNNFSDIPVPIPNTSVVHYAKINTLVTKP